MHSLSRLFWVKAAHAAVWAIFAGCIIAIPIVALRNRLEIVAWLTAIVFLEVLVLICNRMRCPLTGIAARYTTDRRDNFDIFIPEWLARYNKVLFGFLYVGGVAFALGRWVWVR